MIKIIYVEDLMREFMMIGKNNKRLFGVGKYLESIYELVIVLYNFVRI